MIYFSIYTLIKSEIEMTDICKCKVCYTINSNGVLHNCLEYAEEGDDYCLYCEKNEPIEHNKMNICEWTISNYTPKKYESIIKIQKWWRNRK